MTVIRIPGGPLRGVALETRRRTLPERVRVNLLRVVRRAPRPAAPAPRLTADGTGR
jgi:hypothetical protein